MFVITEKAPTGAFSWLKAATTAFTFKNLFHLSSSTTQCPHAAAPRQQLPRVGGRGRLQLRVSHAEQRELGVLDPAVLHHHHAARQEEGAEGTAPAPHRTLQVN